MSSGVQVSPQCLEEFEALKLRRKHRFIIFKLTDDSKEIVVEKTVEDKEGEDMYQLFLTYLPENEPRYAVYDLNFEKDDNEGKRNIITFFSWVPDTAKVRQKMLHASSLDALKRILVGVGMDVQGTDPSEVDYQDVLQKAKNKK